MIGARFKSNGRKLTIIGSYDDYNEQPGYYYRFDGEKAVHWITATGAAARFTKLYIGGDGMTKHQDDRIEPEYVEQMKQFASLVDRYFNPDGRRLNCFVLLVTPFGSEPGRVNYLSNGERDDIVTMMKEVVARFEGQPETKGEA